MKKNIFANYIFTIDDFWTKQECEEFIKKSEGIGYEPATVNTEKGAVRVESIRNNNRVIYNDIDLANNLWLRFEQFAPTKIGNSKAIGFNELFRFYKYESGQQFKRHKDQSFIRDEFEASYYTFMIYLNDHYEGGETTFNNLTIQPKQGTALVFLHDLEHEGSPVKQGVKYVLRTDIMFRLEEE
jgi:prolyl 4-hydroxylase